MRENAMRNHFECEGCGSPSVLLPSVLKDDALVHCSSCGACLGSWQAFKYRAERIIMAEGPRSRPNHVLSSDPLPKLVATR
jgi:uncharacterized Zn finger protein